MSEFWFFFLFALRLSPSLNFTFFFLFFHNVLIRVSIHYLFLCIKVKIFVNLSQEMIDFVVNQLICSYHEEHISQCRTFVKFIVVNNFLTCRSIFPMRNWTSFSINFFYKLSIMFESFFLQISNKFMRMSCT